jgi:hypothetical protein
MDILGQNTNTIDANSCEVKLVSIEDTKQFLEDNHIDGWCVSDYSYGLYYNDVIVSLMTFKQSQDDSFELLRLCDKLFTTVVGGYSKLFKYFITNYNPRYIFSYADRSWIMNNGDTIYDRLGFKFVGTEYPNYYYVIGDIREDKFNYRKSELVKQGFDSNKSEHEIMLDRGIYRIYDSGQLKYEWLNSEVV